jgi:hypothetical protein
MDECLLIEGELWSEVHEPVFLFDLEQNIASIATQYPAPFDYDLRDLYHNDKGGSRQTKTYRLDNLNTMNEAVKAHRRWVDIKFKDLCLNIPLQLNYCPDTNAASRQAIHCVKILGEIEVVREACRELFQSATQCIDKFKSDLHIGALYEAIDIIEVIFHRWPGGLRNPLRQELDELMRIRDELPISVVGNTKLIP